MQRYRIVIMLVLFGVLPVVVAFFVALSFLDEQEIESPPVAEAPIAEPEPAPPPPPPPPPPPETRAVFAAARDLPIGALIGKDDLAPIEVVVTEIEEDYIEVDEVGAELSDDAGDLTPRTLIGLAVRTPIAERAPLTWSAVVGPGQKGFLAAVLRPGTRAVTIRVGAATSHAGLIDPGDLVDVILSAELSIDGGERIVFARTIAEDVRVVAIDRQVEYRGEGAAGREEITTATLEATPAQADRLVLGEHEGRLSLAVRSLAASVAVAKDPNRVEAVELREMLLSSSDFSASEARLRRVQELSDLATRQQLVESKALLKAMIEAGETKRDQVRVFRGTAPAEVVVFESR